MKLKKKMPSIQFNVMNVLDCVCVYVCVSEQQEFEGNFLNQNIHDWSLPLHRLDYWHTAYFYLENWTAEGKKPKSCLANVFTC